MAERLFVYGTLHPDRAPEEIAAVARQFQALGRGWVRGHRLELGEYPGVVLDAAGGLVAGEVFLVPEGAWAPLDAYEGFVTGDLVASLFRRVRTEVELEAGGVVESWIYEWNRGLAGARAKKARK